MGRLQLLPRDHVLGTRDLAIVQLVAYGDYQCPHTRRGVALVGELMEQLGEALLYTFRNFPLGHLHSHAVHAALAAEAAARQNRFWDMHLELFRHQRLLDDDSLRARALRLGLDEQRFTDDFHSIATRAHVLDDLRSGDRLGVSRTPTFFVDGLMYDGDVDGIGALVEEAVLAATAPGAG